MCSHRQRDSEVLLCLWGSREHAVKFRGSFSIFICLFNLGSIRISIYKQLSVVTEEECEEQWWWYRGHACPQHLSMLAQYLALGILYMFEMHFHICSWLFGRPRAPDRYLDCVPLVTAQRLSVHTCILSKDSPNRRHALVTCLHVVMGWCLALRWFFKLSLHAQYLKHFHMHKWMF